MEFGNLTVFTVLFRLVGVPCRGGEVSYIIEVVKCLRGILVKGIDGDYRVITILFKNMAIYPSFGKLCIILVDLDLYKNVYTYTIINILYLK